MASAFKRLKRHLADERRGCLAFVSWFVADGQFVASFSAACGKNFASVLGRHSFTKAVLVAAFAIGRLESAFHSI
ncbi:MAG: hypothetical protein HY22_01285 [[Candidatus Thermochlorobacteriaceae] bacterium GBChlB]|nr:MAG: hypothetical protein HY22_01285 [[Candidatus Thermochlorobacteriaceae] bacterium GBChlB]